jgi:hypothetical protein
MLAIPAQASESSSSSEPNGNACGHYKLDFHAEDLAASVGLSGSKISKCAPDTAAPAGDTLVAAPGAGTTGDSPSENPAGSLTAPALSTSVLRFSGKAVGVPIACPATAPADCTGTIVIKVLVSTSRKRARGAQVQAARRGRKLTVGKAIFRIAPGHKKTISVRISRRGRVLFNKKPSVNAEVGLETRDPGGRKRITRKTVRVKRANGARR